MSPYVSTLAKNSMLSVAFYNVLPHSLSLAWELYGVQCYCHNVDWAQPVPKRYVNVHRSATDLGEIQRNQITSYPVMCIGPAFSKDDDSKHADD
jgi:hypothetical protein